MATRKQSAEDTSNREIVLSRVFDAPRERVFQAWTDPKQLEVWWGPNGCTNTTHEIDVKPAGIWRFIMHGPDGVDYPNRIVYEEIVKPERIVYTHGGGEAGDPANFRTTVTFKALGKKTELTMRAVFPSAAARDFVVKEHGAIEGGKQTLSRLASHLAGEFVLSHLVDAPRERVWKAWTEPEQLKAWFGPKDFETFHARLDFRPGGVYHYGIRNSAGLEVWGKWTFREIAAPERLVFLVAFSDKDGGLGRHPLAPEWPQQMLTTILFADFGGKTLVTIKSLPFEATGTERKTFGKGFAGMRQGWGGTFERLDAHLKPAFKLVMTRVIAAPRARVYEAWTKPEQMAQWFAPKPFKLVIHQMDFRPGGRFSMVMRGPNGEDFPFTGTYREIIPPAKLSWTGEFPGGPADQMTTVVTFEEQGQKTKVHVRQTIHVMTPEIEHATKGAEQGWTLTLDQLEAFCSKEKRP